MTITLPRLRFLAPLFAASVFCASALGGYFSSGSAGVLTACFLLFLLTNYSSYYFKIFSSIVLRIFHQ